MPRICSHISCPACAYSTSGCGPGTISVGLAKAVEPGELHGIDMEESQIELARAAAEAGGHINATFHVGDVTGLPFEDSSFDVAHCHGVLNHVPDTAAVLAEVKRVLKPSGILAAREWIAGAAIWFPPYRGPSKNLLGALIDANGGHSTMGRELKNEFAKAGFTDIVASVSCLNWSSTEEIESRYDWIRNYLEKQFAGEIIRLGLGTQDIDAFLEYLDEWKDHPGAFAANPWGEAIARKPS